MTQTILRLKQEFSLPVEADSISPDRFAGLSQAQVAALPVLVGRRKRTVSDLFEVEGDGSAEIRIEGNLGHVKRIGQAMTQGQITIYGDVGLHLGSGMRGGTITVQGDAGAWAGAGMAGGTIWVGGSAGAMLGGPYMGQARGMRGGTIVVTGDAGPRAGERMRRGLIVVQGNAGELAGTRMIAGTIVVLGTLGARAGAGMKRGTIVALGPLAGGLLPTFHPACTYQPAFLRHYLLHVRNLGLPISQEQLDGTYLRYAGDVNTIGKGEVLVHA